MICELMMFFDMFLWISILILINSTQIHVSGESASVSASKSIISGLTVSCGGRSITAEHRGSGSSAFVTHAATVPCGSSSLWLLE
jgi:hypothetical protein